MTPIWLSHFTATSCIGRGLGQTLAALREQRSGLAPCGFETVELETFIGEVEGVDEVQLPTHLADFECRNNRLALLGLMQDGFGDAVRAAMARHVGNEGTIRDTHQLIRDWCAAHGETISGTVVMIHFWDDEPARRVTEINYLLT